MERSATISHYFQRYHQVINCLILMKLPPCPNKINFHKVLLSIYLLDSSQFEEVPASQLSQDKASTHLLGSIRQMTIVRCNYRGREKVYCTFQ